MSDSDDEMWDSESDSEDYEDRMFDPDSYNPAEHEDVSFNIEDAMKFWDSENNGTIIGDVFQNSLKSLEKNEEEASEPCQLPDIIRILIDKNNKTLSFIDNGVGMTKDELERYESSTRRDLLKVADKVVVTTKHDDDDEHIMVLSREEDKNKFVVATQEDPDLIFRGTSKGTKITLFLKQDEVEHLLEFPTYRVMANKYFSTKIRYHIFIFSKEGEFVKITGLSPNTNSLFEGSYHVNDPGNFLDHYSLPRFVTTSKVGVL